MTGMLVLAQEIGTFGGRDAVGLIFLGLAMIGIWAGFLHREMTDTPPE